MLNYNNQKLNTDSIHTGNNCITPSQVVAALRAGGLPNCTADLIELRREKLIEIETACKKLDGKLKGFIGRCNETEFRYAALVEKHLFALLSDYNDSFTKMPIYMIRLFEYSGLNTTLVIYIFLKPLCYL